jgi:hypothetical protein
MYEDKQHKYYTRNIIIVMKYIFIIICSIILPIVSLKPNICINCKYFLPSHTDLFGKCSFFPIIKENKIDYLVTGEPKEDELGYSYCSTARKFDDMCGEEGKMYKKKRNTKNIKN